MSSTANPICVRCNNELIYNTPPQKTDTTTKNRIEAGYYNCNNCTEEIKAKKKQEREKRKQAKVQKQINIKQHEETKTQSFDRLWRDVDENGLSLMTVNDQSIEIVNLPDHARLFWIYKRHDIRKPEDGFLSYEEAKVIRRENIQSIIQTAMQAKQETTNAMHNDEMTKEGGVIRLAEIELNKKNLLKRQISYVERLHAVANKEQEQLPPIDRERFVKKPGYRDPTGNKAPRNFLLSDRITFKERQVLRNRQIAIIQHVDKLENEISEKNQVHFDENTGALTA